MKKTLSVLIQVRPGSRHAYGATIYESAQTPDQLARRLKVRLKAPKSTGTAGQAKLLRAINITVKRALNSKEECVFVNIAGLFKSAILADGFGIDYQLWIPSRGFDGTAIRAGRDNPQQFLA